MKKEMQRNDTPNSVLRRAAEAQLLGLIGVGLLAMALANMAFPSSVYAQEKSASPNPAGTSPWVAVHVLGFSHAKRNAKGKLTVQSTAVQFETGNTEVQMGFPSIRDVFTDKDNQLVFGGTRGTIVRAALPYGSGRVLGLFHEKVGVLTLEYQDPNGALHGAILRLANGQAVAVKRQIAAASLACACAAPPSSSDLLAKADWGEPGSRADARRGRERFSSIIIEPVEPGDVAVPPDFRVAVYENLIAQVRKTGKFQHVYRSGDRAAADIPDLAVLRMKVEGFREGNEMKRAATTVGGATSIKMSVRVLSRDGQVVVDRRVEGKVRFMGDNLHATYDFAKKAAKVLNQSLSATKRPE